MEKHDQMISDETREILDKAQKMVDDNDRIFNIATYILWAIFFICYMLTSFTGIHESWLISILLIFAAVVISICHYVSNYRYNTISVEFVSKRCDDMVYCCLLITNKAGRFITIKTFILTVDEYFDEFKTGDNALFAKEPKESFEGDECFEDYFIDDFLQ